MSDTHPVEEFYRFPVVFRSRQDNQLVDEEVAHGQPGRHDQAEDARQHRPTPLDHGEMGRVHGD